MSIRDEIEDMGRRIENRVENVISDYLDELDDRIAQASSGAVDETDVMIDATGRIYQNGHHVGWLKRDAYPLALDELSVRLGGWMPNPQDMVEVKEVRQ